MSTLEHLFGSSESIRLLQFALFHPDAEFTRLDLRHRVGRRSFPNTRLLRELVQVGCFVEGVHAESGQPTYRVDPSWILYPEFRALFMKAQLLVEHDLVRQLQKTGRLRLLVLAGLFVSDRGSVTDALVVGSVNRRRVAALFKQFDHILSDEVRYTVMSPAEYRYRKDIGDRFIYDILERRHLVVVDTTQRSTAVRSAPRKRASSRRPARRRS